MQKDPLPNDFVFVVINVWLTTIFYNALAAYQILPFHLPEYASISQNHIPFQIEERFYLLLDENSST